ncbi:MAG TPA: hypothetical protein VK253_02505, partial [Candidatus Binatia bacterium]|nr:hypothetical protein [Candidatus Binatia bacterium]
RTLILKFPYEFKGKNQIDNIERTWLSDPVEVSGIFNWMLEGLRRLDKNREFTLSKTTQEMMLEFKRLSDPFGAWIEDRCIVTPEGTFSRKDGFEDYKNYVDQDLGKAPETERRFYQRLRDMPKIKEYRIKTERGFKGVRLKEKVEAETEAQSKLDSVAEIPGSAGNLNCKNSLPEAADVFVLSKNCAEPVTNSTDTKNSSRLVIRVLPSRGEPCEGSTSAGGDCGFGSEHYLINPQGNRSAWCKNHLKTILSSYDLEAYEICYGMDGVGDG